MACKCSPNGKGIGQRQINAIVLILFNIMLVSYEQSSTNLVCNPGFDNYTLTGVVSNEKYEYVPNDQECWYSIGTLNIEVKQKKYPNVGNCAQLVTIIKYKLCQKIVLTVGATYSMSYNTVNCLKMYSSTIQARLNNLLIMSVTTSGETAVGYGQKQFVAKQINNQLCFSSYYSGAWNLQFFMGPCIDNITIINVPNSSASTDSTNSTDNTTSPISANTTGSQVNSTNTTSVAPSSGNSTTIVPPSSSNSSSSSTNSTAVPLPPAPATLITQIQIYCTFSNSNDQSWQSIQMSCTYMNGGIDFIISKLVQQNSLQIFIQSEKQLTFFIRDIQPTSMKIYINPNRNYKIKKCDVLIPPETLVYMNLNVKFYIDGQEINFTILNDIEGIVLETMSPLSILVMKYTQNVYTVLRASFFSYFLADIISFWNLSLMYNLLPIRSIPKFSKYFLQKLSYQFFKLNSIIEWLQQKIPSINNIIDFKFTKLSCLQLMEDFQNNYAWFGAFGLSTKFFNNNVEQLMMVFLIGLKIGVFVIIRAIFRKIGRCKKLVMKIFPVANNLHIFVFFCQETMVLQIFMLVSAGTALLNYGFQQFLGKFNNVLHMSVVWISIVSFPMFFIHDLQVRRNKLIQKRKQKVEKQQLQKTTEKDEKFMIEQQKVNKNASKRVKVSPSKQLILGTVNNIFGYLLYFMIPTIILLQNSLIFLSINSVIIVGRLLFFIKYGSVLDLSLRSKIFQFFVLFIWLVHNSCFVFFWVLEKIEQSYVNIYSISKIDSQTIQNITKIQQICGFITIFTVISGGMVQIANFICRIIGLIILLIRKILVKCRKNPKIKFHAKQECLKQQAHDQIQKRQMPSQVMQNRKSSKDLNIKSRCKIRVKMSKVGNKFGNRFKNTKNIQIIKKQDDDEKQDDLQINENNLMSKINSETMSEIQKNKNHCQTARTIKKKRQKFLNINRHLNRQNTINENRSSGSINQRIIWTQQDSMGEVNSQNAKIQQDHKINQSQSLAGGDIYRKVPTAKSKKILPKLANKQQNEIWLNEKLRNYIMDYRKNMQQLTQI